MDVLVSGVGTGGTITGVSRFIKKTTRQEDPIGGSRAGGQPGDHADAGGRAAEAGATQDPGHRRRLCAGHARSLAGGRVEQTTNEEAVEFARRLASEEGILSGISSGAAVAVAVRPARRPENFGKTIVVILPDSGERYLSSVLFEGLFNAQGLAA